VAWLSQILHGEGLEESARIVKRAAEALVPEGLLLIHEFLLEDSMDRPLQPALFSLNMLVGTKAGDTYTEAEITGWFADAGFTNIRRIDPPDAGTTLVVGRKA
jgi:hypothetical protein